MAESSFIPQVEPYGSHVDRSYQLEMFRASMTGNKIICMGTGTGKTQVAKLRIEAELRRSPGKRIWFTAPNVVLAEQQHTRLGSYLPQYSFRTLLGHDKVDLWRTEKQWEDALEGIDVVTSTPQVLLDALSHGFIRMGDLSLLVIDEAHHAVAKAPSARIMLDHYHATSVQSRPHILALTASARISEKSASLDDLESTLDAACITPTVSIEEYEKYVNRAEMVQLEYTAEKPLSSPIFNELRQIVDGLTLQDDPYYRNLQLRAITDLAAQQKLEKVQRRGATSSMKEIIALMTNAEHLADQLGSWASDRYVIDCVTAWHELVLRNEQLDIMSFSAQVYINSKVTCIRTLNPITGTDHQVQSVKLRTLIDFLANAYFKGIAIIIFVERRSTAYALCKVLRNSPKLSRNRIFPFVGLSSARSGGLADVANRKAQQVAFEEFRKGSQDICIATSVAEEGIDIQAVNIVIRFDNPKQFVSYLQSRGRARQQKSQYVYFRNNAEDDAMYADFDVFEKELEDEYRKDREEFMRLEQECDEYEEFYVVRSTGAKLKAMDAIKSLKHICDVISRGVSPPIYLLKRDGGPGLVRSTVLLPAQFPPELQSFNSASYRRSEKTAHSDAAFEAVKALHQAGQITDHLLPFKPEKEIIHQMRHLVEQEHVAPQAHVWANSGESMLFRYRMVISESDSTWDSSIMILAFRLKAEVDFPIQISRQVTYRVKISCLGEATASEYECGRTLTADMFGHIFMEGSAFTSFSFSSSIPFAVVPDLKGFNASDATDDVVNLAQYMIQHPLNLSEQPLLIWRDDRQRPYLWRFAQARIERQCQDLNVTKIQHLQIFASTKNENLHDNLPKVFTHPIAEFSARKLSTRYGAILLLMPTILQMVESSLRAQMAHMELFHYLPVGVLPILSQALIAESGFGTFNYERLEFLGDALLKFRVSLALFAENSAANEGWLTLRTAHLVSNQNLTRLAKHVGVAQFITTQATSQKHWQLPRMTIEKDRPDRVITSKVLADVVESTLAAAYLCGSQINRGEEACTETLNMYFEDMIWLHPTEYVQKITSSLQPSLTGALDLINKFKHLTGYEFRHSSLLRQALTHSSSLPGDISYDRLEYLGDAILDIIVKKKLWAYKQLKPGQMSIYRHALVSHRFLSFCALNLDSKGKTVTTFFGGGFSISANNVLREKRLPDLVNTVSLQTRHAITKSQKKLNLCHDELLTALQSSEFPWLQLEQLDAPKVCSDIVESCLAAIFIDSGGVSDHCETFLETLGVTSMVEHMCTAENYVAEGHQRSLAMPTEVNMS